MSDDYLMSLPKDDANKKLSLGDKRRWVFLHNRTANCFYVKDGFILDVPPEGWWY